MPGAKFGDINHSHRGRGGYSHNQPDERRKRKSAKRGKFQDQRVAGGEVVNHAESEQKNACRNRCQNDQRYVDGAVYLLPRAAEFTRDKVGFVVAAHLRSEAGNVIAPACQDFSDYGINACAHNKIESLNQRII